MSGRQEKESDKASMCEWEIWWESRRLVSSEHTKMCSTEGWGILVVVRTGERHEVSEKAGMRKAVCPILSLVMVISRLREGRLKEGEGRGESLIWARIFCSCISLRKKKQKTRKKTLKTISVFY